MMKDKKNNRTKIIMVRITPKEYEELLKKYHATISRKLSDYLRNILLTGKVTMLIRNQSLDEFMAEMIELRKELNAIGNNFNQAEGRGQKIDNTLNQANEIKVIAQRIHYGKTPTKRAIANVLEEVIDQYKYTSFAELNAVLKLYNVVADRGKEDSRMYEQRGLVYSITDDKGNKVGIPIKASAFFNKPTLSYLEKKFTENEKQREAYSKRLQTSIKWVLMKKELTLNGFTEALAKEGIRLVQRQSKKGDVYGLTYVDLKNKSVFNGSDLGKEFSAKSMLGKLKIGPQCDKVGEPQDIDKNIKPSNEMNYIGENKIIAQSMGNDSKEHLSNMMKLLIKSEENKNSVPHELLNKKAKKKKRKLNW